jgi:hypothetical protein
MRYRSAFPVEQMASGGKRFGPFVSLAAARRHIATLLWNRLSRAGFYSESLSVTVFYKGI